MNTWIFDSGAYPSMTWDRSSFITYTPCNTEPARAAGGQAMDIVGQGTLVLQVNVHGTINRLLVPNAYHIPSLKEQILSEGQLEDLGLKLVSRKGKRSFVNSDGTEIVTAERKHVGGLYEVQLGKPQVSLAVRSPTLQLSFKDAHELLGHLNLDTLKIILSRNKLNGIKIVGSTDHFTCETCKAAKSTRLQHDSLAERQATRVGQFVSADLIDCRSIQSAGNFKFASVLVDHFSYMTHVRAIPEKSADAVLQHIREFNAVIRARTSKPIETLRTDRGLEYDNQFLRNFANEQSIKLEFAVAHEPRDNGLVERRNRTLIEAANALLISANLPRRYWAYAVQYACVLQNMIGRKSFKYNSPYQRFFDKAPSVSHLATFGTECWVHTATDLSQKFIPKAVKGRLLGFSAESNGYIVLIGPKVSISRNVTFVREKRFNACSNFGTETVSPLNQNQNPENHTPDAADCSC